MNYAGFWRRFAAVLIDGLILFIPSAILGLVIPGAGVIIWFLYMTFFNSSRLMGTPGKIFMGLNVVTEAGLRISYQQALIRYFVGIVSGLFLCIGYFFNLFTPKRQTLHDIVAGVVVVQRDVNTDVDWVGAWVEEFRRVLNVGTGKGLPGPAAAGSAETPMEQLEKLHDLFNKGAITETEFLAKKAEILKKI